MSLNAFSASPIVPSLPTASGAAVPQNQTPAPAAAAGQGFKLDNYSGLAQSGLNIATKVSPYVPGAVAGIQAHGGVVEAQAVAMRARRSSARAARNPSAQSARGMKSKAMMGRGRPMPMRAASAPGATGTFFGGVLGAVKSSVLFGGAISLAFNGYKLFKKQETTGDAAANVTGDLASAVVGGAAGAMASAGVTAMVGAAVTGIPLMLIGGAVGIGAYLFADKFFRASPVYTSIQGGVRKLFGGK